MVIFVVGAIVGVLVTIFVLGLIAASDEYQQDTEKEHDKMIKRSVPDKCKGCRYQYFASEPHDCAICHEFANEAY